MTIPNHPKHADYEWVIAGQGGERFTGKRVLDRYAYAANGNVHNPTPYYYWVLMVDGRKVDQFNTRRELLAAVATNGQAYLKEIGA